MRLHRINSFQPFRFVTHEVKSSKMRHLKGLKCLEIEKKQGRKIHLGSSVTLHPSMILSHLQLSDPGTVPVGLPSQLDKELPLSSALHGWWWGGIRRGIRSRGNGDGRRRFTPSPVEDLLNSSFDWRTLEEGKRQSDPVSVSRCCVYSPTAEWECLGAHRASRTQPLSVGDLRQRRV